VKTTFLPIDHEAFDSLTSEARYWVGFLMADGCLTLAKRTRKSGKTVFYKMIALNLSVKDVTHIRRFREFLKSKHKITVYTYNTNFGRTTQARFAFISPSIWHRLLNLGVKPRKSKGCSIDDSLAVDRDFWRGIIDGNGSVYISRSGKTKVPFIQLCACSKLAEQFKNYVKKLTGCTYAISKTSSQFCFTVKCNGWNAYCVIKTLYKDANVALKRKQKTANQIMEVSLVD